tara:strand:+ start:238 stop:657 length:420 start_codon:yes stop_codon:yes gene_type:complete
MSYTYKTLGNYPEDISPDQPMQNILRKEDEAFIPLDEENSDYQTYLKDIQTHGMSIVEVSDCRNGVPDKSMWQYVDNAEQLVVDKYGSDSDKLKTLREDRYVAAMKAKTPYGKKIDAYKIIDATPHDIKDKYKHLPMRR